ncbi:MAG: TylF/MycF/NovP-related O-methyltransferase [Fimbriimonadaceae bacterium]
MGLKKVVRRGLARMGWQLERIEKRVTDEYSEDGLHTIHSYNFVDDPRFIKAYERGVLATGEDYHFRWRVHTALWIGRTASRLEGDFVECGVNRGFMSSAIMSDLEWEKLGKTFWLLDTFQGLDEKYVTEAEKKAGLMKHNLGDYYVRGVESVQRNFAEWPSAKIVVGTVPETLSEVTSEKIAFLHLDMNCMEPEVAALEHFWPKLVPGGMVLMDDFAYSGFAAQNKGLSALAAKFGVTVFNSPTGQGVMIKPPK